MKNKKPLRVPVTEGLKDIYSMDMRLAYQAALLGQFNVVAFSRLAAAISVVRTALEQNRSQIPAAIETLDTAIGILMQVKSHGDETGLWAMGIEMAEACIGTLDVTLLEQSAAQLLKTIAGE
jgi:hypothetical protein